MGLLELRPAGLYCAAGDFYLDPQGAVLRAVISHAHTDHTRAGCGSYLGAATGLELLRRRLPRGATLESLGWGARRTIGSATVSLHPAGHILGSAQVRVEHRGEVWVYGGDSNASETHACAEPFEAVACDTYITESTFGLPIYRWRPQAEVFGEIHAWWRACREARLTAVIGCYPLGKAQRLLAGLDAALGPIAVQGHAVDFIPAYAAAGVRFPAWRPVDEIPPAELRGQGLIIATGDLETLLSGPAGRALGPVATAFASGWMAVRGARRWQDLDRGFVLSDHSDFAGLDRAAAATGARRVLVTHGFTEPYARWQREAHGREAAPLGRPESGQGAEGRF